MGASDWRGTGVRVTSSASRDYADVMRWTRKGFGVAAAVRYETLIIQAVQDVARNPERTGSREHPQLLGSGVRTYHLKFSRDHVPGDRVKAPRHFLLYRQGRDGIVEVARILHERGDLARNAPHRYRAGASE